MAITTRATKDDAKKRSFDPLPAGWYHMVVSEIELAEVKKEDSKYFGAPMFKLEFRVTEDDRNPRDEDDEPIYDGRWAWRTMMLAEGTLGWGVAEFLYAVGALTEKIVAGADVDIPAPDEFEYIGKGLMVRMGASKEARNEAREESKRSGRTVLPETQPTGYKSEDEEQDDSGPAPTATGARRLL